jgi:putative PIN family toxin of toxin-antitoxin system
VNVVLDTNVVVSGIFWPGDDRECLALWARRRFSLALSPWILAEYCEVARRLAGQFPQVNPEPWLHWIEAKARVYEPAPLGKQRSRDAEDDPFLAVALGSGARFLVSKDRDLLVLGKPFGVEILRPSQFLRRCH